MADIRLACLIAAALLVSGCATRPAVTAPAPAPAESPALDPEVDWRAAARQDVLGAYRIYAENHPGMHDPRNPGFPAQLARARDRGLAVPNSLTGPTAYVEALGAFSAELEDGHAQAYAKPMTSGPVRREWPGFVAAWRGDRVLIHHAVDTSPAPAGSTIVSCNGMPVRDFIQGRLGNRGLRPNEAGRWWSEAPTAFYVSLLTFSIGRPERCVFALPDGTVREAELSWSPMPDDYFDRRTIATDGERTPIGLTEPRPGLFLVGMPDFNPDQEGVEAYRRLFQTLRQRREELKDARAVVIDLRHNNGGSSAWSREGAEILWGKDVVTRKMEAFFRGVRIWWRASPDNVAYMSEMESNIRNNGLHELADETRATGMAMRAALERGEPFHVQPAESGQAAPGDPPRSDFDTPVYIITPGRCGSACLDAVDVISQFENVKRIGAPTSADSVYMEVRQADLPSGRGGIIVPIKIWMDRPRASGQVYMPHIPVNDLDWSTATFLDRVERDLARSG